MEVADNAVSGQDAGNTGKAYNSIDDAISAAISASEKVQAPVSEVKAEEPAPESVDQKAGEARDGEDAKTAVKEPAEDKIADPLPKDGQHFEAPKHWPEADRQAFAKMPPENQAIIKRLAKDLEGGFTRKSQELGDKARYADAVRGLVDDHTRSLIAQSGANEIEYFAHLNKLQQWASRDGPSYIKWAMQSLGVTPDHLGIAPPKQPEPVKPAQPAQDDLSALFQDPRVNELESRLAQLHGKLTEREQAEKNWLEHQQREQQAQEFARKAAINQTIESFRTSLDDNGQLRFPHFDQVRHVMASLLNDPAIANKPDPNDRMQAAYEQAIWARPDLRASFLEQEASKRAADKIKAQEAARAKAVTAVKPASGVATSSAKPKTLDDIISDAMTQHGR